MTFTNPLCNPSLTSCPVTQPFFYDQSGPVPTNVPAGAQPVPVPKAYLDASVYHSYANARYFQKDAPVTSDSISEYHVADLTKSADDQARTSIEYLEQQAADEETFLIQNADALNGRSVDEVYDSLPYGLRPPEQYRYGWYINVQTIQDVDDSGNLIQVPAIFLSQSAGMGSAMPGLGVLVDSSFYGEPVPAQGTTPIFAVIDSRVLQPPDPVAVQGFMPPGSADSLWNPYLDPYTDTWQPPRALSGNRPSNTIVIDSGSNDTDDDKDGFDSYPQGKILAAGGFLVRKSDLPSVDETGGDASTGGKGFFSSAVPAAGLFALSYGEAYGLENFAEHRFGIPRDATRALRPFTIPGLAYANGWAISESSIWLNANVSRAIPAIRPDWVTFRQGVPGMVAVGKMTSVGMNWVGDLTGWDSFKRGGIVNTVGSFAAPLYFPRLAARSALLTGLYRWTPEKLVAGGLERLAASYPSLARYTGLSQIFRWSPVKVAGDALAAVTVIDLGLSVGESLRAHMPWYDATNKLDDALFNTAHQGECDDAWFPGICTKYLQIKTHFSEDKQSWDVFQQWSKGIDGEFTGRMRNSILPIMALDALVPSGDDDSIVIGPASSRLSLDWAQFRNSLKGMRERPDVQGVFGILQMVENARNSYGADSDQGKLLDISFGSGLQMRDFLEEKVGNQEMSDQIRNLLNRQDLNKVVDEAIAAHARELNQTNIDLGLAMGIHLKKTNGPEGTHGLSIGLNCPNKEGGSIFLEDSDEFYHEDPYDPYHYMHGMFKGYKFQMKTSDGVFFAHLETPDGKIMTDMTAAWDDTKKDFVITTTTTAANGRVIVPTQVTYSDEAILPMPIKNAERETTRELGELTTVSAYNRTDWQKERIELLTRRKAFLEGGQAMLQRKVEFLEGIAQTLDPSNPDAKKNRQDFLASIDFDSTLNGKPVPAPSIAFAQPVVP